MKTVSSTLLADLENQLNQIQYNNADILQQTRLAVKATVKKLEALKTAFTKHNFENKAEEIDFFKNCKPQITSKLIYYNEIYKIEISKPTSTYKDVQKYYNKELAKLKNFFNDNKDFYKYYRSGTTCLDKKYFLRRKHDIRLTIDSNYFQSDYDFATSYDYKVAKIIANDALKIFLENKVEKHKKHVHISNQKQENLSLLNWTASKVALVELLYALHSEGVFNNGTISLNETAKNFEKAFNVQLGQFNRIFSEIKKRKTIEQTSFLSSLKDNLSTRINDSDQI